MVVERAALNGTPVRVQNERFVQRSIERRPDVETQRMLNNRNSSVRHAVHRLHTTRGASVLGGIALLACMAGAASAQTAPASPAPGGAGAAPANPSSAGPGKTTSATPTPASAPNAGTATAQPPPAAPATPAAAPKPPANAAPPATGARNATHGALPLAEQQNLLTPWTAQSCVVAAPRGVGPEYWRAITPAGNPGTEAQVALGRKLYFETRLSKDGTVACATCHDVSRGFSDRRNTSEGIGDQIGHRNAPTTLNALFFATQFLDGRAGTLEEQALLPITNPIEMGMPNGAAAAAAIAQDPEYQRAFQSAYGRPPNFEDVGRAIASFERTLVFLDSPFDRFSGGDVNAISSDARAGWALFNGKGRCASCHQMSSQNAIGTDNRFHNIGVSARHQNFENLAQQALKVLQQNDSRESIDRLAIETDLSELGRFVVTRDRSDIGAFKTSQVRNVGVTAPYMHDGSLATLWDVVDHYNKGGEANPYLDGGIEPLALSDREVDQLVAFLFTLTDVRLSAQNEAELARQRGLAASRRSFRDTNLANRQVIQFETRLKGGK